MEWPGSASVCRREYRMSPVAAAENTRVPRGPLNKSRPVKWRHPRRRDYPSPIVPEVIIIIVIIMRARHKNPYPVVLCVLIIACRHRVNINLCAHTAVYRHAQITLYNISCYYYITHNII